MTYYVYYLCHIIKVCALKWLAMMIKPAYAKALYVDIVHTVTTKNKIKHTSQMLFTYDICTSVL